MPKLIKLFILPVTLMSGTVFAQTDVPRFELGGQFSLLSVNRPSQLTANPQIPGYVGFAPATAKGTEPGIGGRFTFNLTKNFAIEAETNLFPRNEFSPNASNGAFVGDFGPGPRGRIFQGQFGAKVGKRFHKIGIFGKVRPGFVGFSRVTRLLITSTVANAPGQPPFVVGTFGTGRKLYFSTDVGVVVEHYLSKRILTRFDLGDTIIRYGEFVGPGAFLSRAIITRPPETKQNLQFSAGVGFRF